MRETNAGERDAGVDGPTGLIVLEKLVIKFEYVAGVRRTVSYGGVNMALLCESGVLNPASLRRNAYFSLSTELLDTLVLLDL